MSEQSINMSCMFTTAQVLSVKRNPVLKQSWIIHASQYTAEWNLFSWIRILPENEQCLVFVKSMCTAMIAQISDFPSLG